MSRVTTQPDLRNSLKFCCFLLDEEESLHRNDNETWAREAKAHKFNLTQLLKFIETESEENKMVMSQKSYDRCIATFGKSFVEKLFKNVTIVPYDTPPVDAEKLFADIKAKGSASRTKVFQQQPAGFFNEGAHKAFESALFNRQNGTNGHKGMPTMATTFSQLRQARIEGELAEQFTMLSQNILLSNEYTAEVKAQKMANLSAEYADLVKGGK